MRSCSERCPQDWLDGQLATLLVFLKLINWKRLFAASECLERGAMGQRLNLTPFTRRSLMARMEVAKAKKIE